MVFGVGVDCLCNLLILDLLPQYFLAGDPPGEVLLLFQCHTRHPITLISISTANTVVMVACRASTPT